MRKGALEVEQLALLVLGLQGADGSMSDCSLKALKQVSTLVRMKLGMLGYAQFPLP